MTGLKTYSDKTRRQFVHALTSIDHYWGEMFGDNLFYDLNYSDLFTRMWLQAETPFRKTELYQFMPRVSQRTAAKHIQLAIDRGLLLETPDTDDRRSKRVSMSGDLKSKIEQFSTTPSSCFSKA